MLARSSMLRMAGRALACITSIALPMVLQLAHASSNTPEIRLYALDCGRIVFQDMAMFSDTGEYDGTPGTLANPCFLVRHPQGTMLWDAGLGDDIAERPEGVDFDGSRFHVDVRLTDQLQALGLNTGDIDFLAFSHFHLDHAGNAARFAESTWIVHRRELEAALGPAPPIGVDRSLIAAHEQVEKVIVDGDHDVFGDGTVRIMNAPGHTPGHQVAIIRLRNSGSVVLSGDLYHTRDNRKFRRVPTINTSRADTLASMDRIERVVESLRARVIVQHDPEDFRSLPRFPHYLD